MEDNSLRGLQIPPQVDIRADPLSLFLSRLELTPHAWREYADQAPLKVKGRVLGDYEIILVHRGMADVTMGERTVRIEEGKILLLPPYLKHSIVSCGSSPFENGWAHFDIRPYPFRQRFNRLWDCASGRIISSGPAAAPLRELFATGETIEEPGTWIRVRAALMFFLSHSCSAHSCEVAGQTIMFEEGLERCLNMIETQFKHRLTSEDICRECGVGRTALFKLFREGLGISPGELLENLRLREAERLLKENPGITLLEIARESGFSSPPLFYRSFARRYGKTPGEFRMAFLRGGW